MASFPVPGTNLFNRNGGSHLDPSQTPLMPVGYKGMTVVPSHTLRRTQITAAHKTYIKNSYPIDSKSMDINLGDIVFQMSTNGHLKRFDQKGYVGHQTLGNDMNEIVTSAVNGLDTILGFQPMIAKTEKDIYVEASHFILSHINIFGMAMTQLSYDERKGSDDASFAAQFGGITNAPTHVPFVQIGEYLTAGVPDYEKVNAPSWKMVKGMPASKIGLILKPVREYSVDSFFKQVLVLGTHLSKMSVLHEKLGLLLEKQVHASASILRFVKKAFILVQYAIAKVALGDAPNNAQRHGLLTAAAGHMATLGLDGAINYANSRKIDLIILKLLSGEDKNCTDAAPVNRAHGEATHLKELAYGGDKGLGAFTNTPEGRAALAIVTAMSELSIGVGNLADLFKSNIVGRCIRNSTEGDFMDVVLNM